MVHTLLNQSSSDLKILDAQSFNESPDIIAQRQVSPPNFKQPGDLEAHVKRLCNHQRNFSEQFKRHNSCESCIHGPTEHAHEYKPLSKKLLKIKPISCKSNLLKKRSVSGQKLVFLSNKLTR